MTRGPEPNRPMTWGPDPTLTGDPRRGVLAPTSLTLKTDTNQYCKKRYQFCTRNGRSLYIVDWWMVVVKGGNVLHHENEGGIVREGGLSGGGICPGGKCPDPVCSSVIDDRAARQLHFVGCVQCLRNIVVCNCASSCPVAMYVYAVMFSS